MPESEIWADLVNDKDYQISNLGRVRTKDRYITYINGQVRFIKGKIIKPDKSSNGYARVSKMFRGKIVWRESVHRLVAFYFVPGYLPGLIVCHNDGNKTNNHYQNLRWDTYSNNSRDAVQHGTNKKSSKKICSRNHDLTGDNLVKKIDHRNGRFKRECLACAKAGCYNRFHGKVFDLKSLSDFYYSMILSIGPKFKIKTSDVSGVKRID